ncbi:MAG: hypothetical protein R3E97_08010 [Candidatus Eisenbacteria bacterium]
MDWKTRLEQLDRRIIFIVIFFAVLMPLFFPLGLSIKPGPEATAFHAAIEALQPGDAVYLAADYDPGSLPELQPMLEAAIEQLCRKDVRIIAGSLWPACPPLVNRAFTEIAQGRFNKVYGTDYVNLGFKEGREVVMNQLGQSIRGVYPVDSSGAPIADMPVMSGVDSYADIKLIVNVSAGYPGTKEWVQQVRSRYSIPLVAGCTAVSAPEYFPYFQSGQLSGLLGGLAGAAEYEVLVSGSGPAAKKMDAQSLGHIVIIGFILLGNLIYFLRSREGSVA